MTGGSHSATSIPRGLIRWWIGWAGNVRGNVWQIRRTDAALLEPTNSRRSDLTEEVPVSVRRTVVVADTRLSIDSLGHVLLGTPAV